MKCKLLTFFFLFIFSLQANDIAIDEISIKQMIEANPDLIVERKILIRYYQKQYRYEEAIVLCDEILNQHKNKPIKELKEKIQKEQKMYILLHKSGFSSPSNTLEIKNFKSSSKKSRNLYEALFYFNYPLPLAYHEKMAEYYYKKKEFEALEKIFQHYKAAKSQKLTYLQAEFFFEQKSYSDAYQLFAQLYNKNKKKEYALGMLRAQIALNDVNSVEFYEMIINDFAETEDIKFYYKDIQKLKEKKLEQLQTLYEKKKTFMTMKDYSNALFKVGDRAKAIEIANSFQDIFPSKKLSYFIAELYYWSGDNQSAIAVLSRLNEPMQAKSILLLGKLYSQLRSFEEAKSQFVKLIHHKNQIFSYEAQKQLAYILLWTGEKEEAIKRFNLLLNSKQDKEILATLRVINDFEKDPISFYKKKLAQNPQDDKSRILLAQIYLKDKSTQKKGLELLQYNAQKNKTRSALILLAKNALWSYHYDLAQRTVEEILKKDTYDKEALALQKKIAFIQVDNDYFANKYSDAIVRYKQLELRYHLNDRRKLQEALSYEKANQHLIASKKFKIIYNQSKSEFSLYHWAFNDMKSGKLEQAKDSFLILSKRAPKDLNTSLKDFISNWTKAWESRNFESYRLFYNSKITNNKNWIKSKKRFFRSTDFIDVNLDNIRYKELEKNHYQISFYQEYHSKFLKDSGYKELSIYCESEDSCQITKEKWFKTKRDNSILLYTLAQKNIKTIEKRLSAPKTTILANGLALAPTVGKNHLSEEEVLVSLIAQPVEFKKLKIYAPVVETEETIIMKHKMNRHNTLGLRMNYYTEKNDIEFFTLDAILKRSYLFDSWTGAIDSGYFVISGKNKKIPRESGYRSGVSISNEHFYIRLGFNKYEKYSEIAPTFSYENSYKNLSYTLNYSYQNALFYTKSPKALHHKITTHHYEVSSYVYDSDSHNLWSSIALNSYSNDNIATIAQFDYSFYRFMKSDNFYIDTSLNGWYMFNTRKNNQYYSPSAYDSTLMALRPIWRLSPYFHLDSSFALGYSVHSESPLYNFALKLSMPERQGFRYELGCRESNAAKNGFESIDYFELDCSAMLDYRW